MRRAPGYARWCFRQALHRCRWYWTGAGSERCLCFPLLACDTIKKSAFLLASLCARGTSCFAQRKSPYSLLCRGTLLDQERNWRWAFTKNWLSGFWTWFSRIHWLSQKAHWFCESGDACRQNSPGWFLFWLGHTFLGTLWLEAPT